MAEDPPFLRLPTEIRLQIYGYLYEQPEGKAPVEATFPIWGSAPIWLHKLELRRGNLYAACNSTKRSFCPILQVCRLVNEEVLDLLFERLLFAIYISGKERDSIESPGPPLLGVAKDFTFWQRARRILLVNIDFPPTTIMFLPYSLGAVFRCFKSTPQDTTTYLYLHDDDRMALSHNTGVDHIRYGRCIEKSLALLSRRAHFEFEIHCYWEAEARDRIVELMDATHGSAKLAYFNPEKCGVSSETVDRRIAADEMLSGAEEGTKRIVCWMSEHSRHDASVERVSGWKRERMRLKKAREERNA